MITVGGDDVGDTGRIDQGIDRGEEEIVGQDRAVGGAEGPDEAQRGVEHQYPRLFIRDEDLAEFFADEEAARLLQGERRAGFVEGSKRGFQLQVFVQYQYSVVSAVQDINMTVGGHGKVGGELHGTAAEGFARDDGFGQIALRRLGWRAPMVVPVAVVGSLLGQGRGAEGQAPAEQQGGTQTQAPFVFRCRHRRIRSLLIEFVGRFGGDPRYRPLRKKTF